MLVINLDDGKKKSGKGVLVLAVVMVHSYLKEAFRQLDLVGDKMWLLSQELNCLASKNQTVAPFCTMYGLLKVM
jgi:hypothetical protein